MTSKSDYTEEEWEGLLEAPIMTGTYIMAADVSITAMGKEMKGMLQAMQSQEAPEAAQELINAIVVDILAKAEDKEKLETPDLDKSQDPLPQILETIVSGTAVLDEKCTPEEAAGFRAWLLQIAQATAEAGKEGGFLGIGAVRVSDKEKAALANLQKALGL